MTHFCHESDYSSLESVMGEYPSVACIEVVEGGWMVFDFHTDFDIWRQQY